MHGVPLNAPSMRWAPCSPAGPLVAASGIVDASGHEGGSHSPRLAPIRLRNGRCGRFAREHLAGSGLSRQGHHRHRRGDPSAQRDPQQRCQGPCRRVVPARRPARHCPCCVARAARHPPDPRGQGCRVRPTAARHGPPRRSRPGPPTQHCAASGAAPTTPRPCPSPRATTSTGSALRRRSPTCAQPRRSPHPAGAPAVTGSTSQATAQPTAHCT